MTDFSHAINEKCPHCGASFCREEGYNCDCMIPYLYVHTRYQREQFNMELQGMPEEWPKKLEEFLIDEGLIEMPMEYIKPFTRL